MQTYSAPEISQFLKTMDEFLSETTEVIIIGGTAAALAYKVSRFTTDVDIFYARAERLKEAHLKAQDKLKIEIPLEQAAVADGPYNFEDRLCDVDLKLKFLKVRVPEIHDLILMKTMRSYAHDLDAIREMAEKNTLDLSVFRDRFLNEMTHVIGENSRIQINFLAMIETAFGEKAVEEIVKELKF